MLLRLQVIVSLERARQLQLFGGMALPAARDSSEVARTLNQRCYHYTGNGGHSWCLNNRLSLLVDFTI